MSRFFRERIEQTIAHMIELLDQLDGDPDLEPEPVEEQHDREIDCVPPCDMSAVIAVQSLSKRRH